MVRKKTIGKFQLIAGVIILLIGIIGVIYAFSLNTKLKKEMYKDIIPSDIKQNLKSSNLSNDTQRIMLIQYINIRQNQTLFEQQKVILLILFSSLAIILSLLFVFRGILNISKLKQKKIMN